MGGPWPLVRLVSVSGNLPHGVLPPFCRLIDSPGLGGDESLTGVDTFTFIKRCLHDRVLLSEVWYVSSFSRDVATTTLTDMDQLGQLIGYEQVRFVVTAQSDMSNVLVDNAEYSARPNSKSRPPTSNTRRASHSTSPRARQTLFVSAMGHTHHRNIPLPGLRSRLPESARAAQRGGTVRQTQSGVSMLLRCAVGASCERQACAAHSLCAMHRYHCGMLERVLTEAAVL